MVLGCFGNYGFLNMNNMESIFFRVQSYTFLWVISSFSGKISLASLDFSSLHFFWSALHIFFLCIGKSFSVQRKIDLTKCANQWC